MKHMFSFSEAPIAPDPLDATDAAHATDTRRSGRRRRCLAHAGLAALAALLLAACADPVTGADRPSAMRFGFVEPDVTVSEYELNIAGPGMETISEIVFSDSAPVTIEVPSGRSRTIELLTDDVYSGRVIRNLAPGQEYEISMPLRPGPVVPDFGASRIVQFRDETTTGWNDLSPDTDPPFIAEYDANGRIWVGGAAFGDTAYLSRIENLDDAGAIDDGILYPSSTRALAVDEDRELVYAAVQGEDGGELVAFDFDGRFEAVLEDFSANNTYGMTVGPNGLLVFLIRQFSDLEGEDLVVVADDPQTLLDGEAGTEPKHEFIVEATVGADLPDFPTPAGDVTTHEGRIIVANGIGGELLELDAELELVQRFGRQGVPEATEPGDFLGPRRFVSSRTGDRLLLIDQVVDSEMSDPEDGRIISLEDLTTDGWIEFGEFSTNPSEPGEFGFFFGGT